MPFVRKEPRIRNKHFLKEWRKHRGISQQSAADAARISASNLSKIENGLVRYSQDLIERLAEHYQCEPYQLIEYHPDNVPDFIVPRLSPKDNILVSEFVRALHMVADAKAAVPPPQQRRR